DSFIQGHVSAHIVLEELPELGHLGKQAGGHVYIENGIAHGHYYLLLATSAIDIPAKGGPGAGVFQSFLPAQVVFPGRDMKRIIAIASIRVCRVVYVLRYFNVDTPDQINEIDEGVKVDGSVILDGD